MSLNLFLTSHPLDAEKLFSGTESSRRHRDEIANHVRDKISLETVMMISSKKDFSPLDAAWLSSWLFTAEITAEFVHRLELLFLLKQKHKINTRRWDFELSCDSHRFIHPILIFMKQFIRIENSIELSFRGINFRFPFTGSPRMQKLRNPSLDCFCLFCRCRSFVCHAWTVKSPQFCKDFVCKPANLFLRLIYMVLGFN